MPPLNSSMKFVEGTDDLHCDVYSKQELVAAILAVQPGCATIITLHRESGAVTRFIFNWRIWHRSPRSPSKKSDAELQHLYLHRAAQRARALPRECFK